MRTIVYNVPSSSDIVKALNRKSIDYEITYTNNTTGIKCEVGGQKTKYLCSDRGLNFRQLGFLQKVKSYVEGLGKPQMNVMPGQIQYYRWNKLEPGYYEPVTEIDVNKAYWLIAYQKGYLSREIYEQGLKVDKMTRLIAWGCIAASSRTYEVKNGKKKLIGEKCNKVTRSYFFDVADELGQIMSDMLNAHSKSILFYWVDAFFIKGRNAPAVIQKEMALRGLPCKVVPLWHIHVKNRNEFSDLITVTEKGGKEKPFHRKKGNRQLYQFQNFCSILEKIKNTPL